MVTKIVVNSVTMDGLPTLILLWLNYMPQYRTADELIFNRHVLHTLIHALTCSYPLKTVYVTFKVIQQQKLKVSINEKQNTFLQLSELPTTDIQALENPLNKQTLIRSLNIRRYGNTA